MEKGIKRVDVKGPKYTWLACDVCGVRLSDEGSLKEHLEGKKHKRMELIAKGEITRKLSVTKESVRCELCDVTCSCKVQYAKHVAGKKHARAQADCFRLGRLVPEPTFILPIPVPSTVGNQQSAEMMDKEGPGLEAEMMDKEGLGLEAEMMDKEGLGLEAEMMDKEGPGLEAEMMDKEGPGLEQSPTERMERPTEHEERVVPKRPSLSFISSGEECKKDGEEVCPSKEKKIRSSDGVVPSVQSEREMTNEGLASEEGRDGVMMLKRWEDSSSSIGSQPIEAPYRMILERVRDDQPVVSPLDPAFIPCTWLTLGHSQGRPSVLIPDLAGVDGLDDVGAEVGTETVTVPENTATGVADKYIKRTIERLTVKKKMNVDELVSMGFFIVEGADERRPTISELNEDEEEERIEEEEGSQPIIDEVD